MVGHDAVVVAAVALPGLVVLHRDARVLRLVHDLRRGRLLRIHHMVVPQHLQAAPHVDRRRAEFPRQPNGEKRNNKHCERALDVPCKHAVRYAHFVILFH